MTDKQFDNNTLKTNTTCWAITSGEYSGYEILAVFTTRKAAEASLPAYQLRERDCLRIEELRIHPVNSSVPPTLPLIGRRQDRKPCPYCHMERPRFLEQMTSGSWSCSGCGMRGPIVDPTGHKWDSLPRENLS